VLRAEQRSPWHRRSISRDGRLSTAADVIHSMRCLRPARLVTTATVVRMNATAPVLSRLRNPADVVAALPYLLGFHPRDSLVVVTVEPGSPPTVGLVLRADLPPPAGEHELVEQICTPLRARRDLAAILVVISAPAHPPSAVVDLVRGALAGMGVPVAHALWAESTGPGARWGCLDDPGHAGLLPDSTSSPLAAATAAAGLITYADREELWRLVAPDSDEALQRRAVLLDAAVETADRDRSAAGSSAVLRAVCLVRTAVHAAADGRLPSGDDEVVQLAVALSEPLVRDCSLGLCLAGSARAAEHLWLALTRATPPPEVAEPAALAALSAYLRGDGALAGMALDRALDAWPGHTLATLVQQVVQLGVPPYRLRQIVSDAQADAQLDLAGDDPAAAG
jgi:Domain of unknown function (DUF4192)